MANYTYQDELYHFGIAGMKWGIRRYQNEDGSLTEEGRARYNKMARKLEKYDEKAKKHAARATESLKSKAAVYNAKAKKYERKSAKVRRKGERLILPWNKDYVDWKASRLDLKASKNAEYAAKLIRKYQSQKAASEHYTKKGEKLIKKIDKLYKDVPVSQLDANDVATVNAYRERHSGD